MKTTATDAQVEKSRPVASIRGCGMVITSLSTFTGRPGPLKLKMGYEESMSPAP